MIEAHRSRFRAAASRLEGAWPERPCRARRHAESTRLNSRLTTSIYETLVDEEDARVCKDITEEACRVVPGNFLLIVGANFMTKLGDALINPKTVLAWLMSNLNAPVYLLGFLVPLRESGSLMPQLFLASWVRSTPVRKWIWVAGSLIQCGAVAGMAWCALTLRGAAAGWTLVALLVLFSLARGLCSVSSKDVLGKTIPKTRRGRVAGLSAGLAGGITVVAGVYLLVGERAASADAYVHLIAAAAGCWLIASLLYARVEEHSGETAGGGDAVKEAWRRLALLRSDKPFRLFVVVRALLLCSGLTAPYYVALAQQNVGNAVYLLGLLVIVDGCASLASAPFWGRFADRSSRRVMVLSAAWTGALGLFTWCLLGTWPGVADEYWIYPLLFFALSIAHNGVRLGRKTYVVDLAGGNRRTDYVAVSNTVIGVLLLGTGTIGFIASAWSSMAVIVILSLLALLGAGLARRLPEVQTD